MTNQSFPDPRNFHWLFSALLVVNVEPAGAAPRSSVEDALTSPEFIRNCIGNVDGEIFVYIEGTYRNQARVLQRSFAAELHRFSTTAPIRFRGFDEGEREASCATIPMAWASNGDDPGLTMYLTLSKGADDRFSAIDVVIQRREGCQHVTLRRDAWIDDCGVARGRRPPPRTSLVTPLPATAARPHPPALLQGGGRDGSGLLIVGGVFGALGTTAFVLRPAAGGMPPDGALTIFLAGPSFNLLALGLLAGGASLRGGRDGRRHHAGDRARLAAGFITGGGVLLAVGVSSWAAGIAQLFQGGHSSDTTCHEICAVSLSAIGQMSTVTGASLLGYGVTFRKSQQRRDRRRFTVAPQIGSPRLGFAIIGRF